MADADEGSPPGPPDGPPAVEDDRPRLCAKLDQNDRDNGRRLLAWFGEDLVYVTGMGWLTWRGTHWQRDEGDLGARLKAQELVDKIKLECEFIEPSAAGAKLLAAADSALAKKEEDRTPADLALIKKSLGLRDALAERRAKRHTWAVTSGNTGKTEGMLKQAASHTARTPDDLDVDAKQFNVRNGTIAFRKTENLDSDPDSPTYSFNVVYGAHNRDDFNTKLADVEYQPDAKCPLFATFLERTQPQELMRRFIQTYHGYALLLGGNDEQLLLYHFGTGANGKTALIEALGRLGGTYRAVVSPDTITGEGQRDGSKANSDIARLHSARLVTIEELPRNTPLKENLIKALTGGTRQVARFLQKEIFEFDPKFTAIMSGNDMPSTTGQDYGLWRRLKIVHWGVTIPEGERIPFGDLMAKFDLERPGILNWLIEGALRYLNEGLAVPPEVNAFTDDYREERDNVGVFASSCIVPMVGSQIKAGELFKAYTEWCEANGLRPATQRSFGDRLVTLGYKKKRGGNYVYLDVALQVFTTGKGGPPPRDADDPGPSPRE